GGIYSAGIGVVRLIGSALVDNTTVAAGGGMATFGDVYLDGTTIAHNHSDELAGAVAALGHVTGLDSSVFDNTAALGNGGLEGGNGITLAYSTVVRNSGTQIEAFGSHLTAFASIIAGRGGPNCHVSQSAVSSGWDVDAGDGGRSCLFGSSPRVMQPARVRLASVAGILGVPVLAPPTGSPLINAIPRSACFNPQVAHLLPKGWNLRLDQLGTSRPQGGRCDIGAIERTAAGGRHG
ncbi:MAG: hypothetical protein JO304_26330, partial [Solirubrobacterales bacterium]|nr:hypothetical protein [Solirubrobacterales bacterium]